MENHFIHNSELLSWLQVREKNTFFGLCQHQFKLALQNWESIWEDGKISVSSPFWTGQKHEVHFREIVDHSVATVTLFYERMKNTTFMINFLISSLGGRTVILNPSTSRRKESKNVFPPATSRSGHVWLILKTFNKNNLPHNNILLYVCWVYKQALFIISRSLVNSGTSFCLQLIINILSFYVSCLCSKVLSWEFKWWSLSSSLQPWTILVVEPCREMNDVKRKS